MNTPIKDAPKFFQKWRYLLGGIGLILFCFAAVWIYVQREGRELFPSAVRLGDTTLALEIAVADADRRRGLSGRDSLCQTCGMLFVFERSGQYAFWMQGMRFPLDILWLSGDTVVFMARDVSPTNEEIIVPDVAAERVLEVNAGAAQGIKRGERVKFVY